MALLHAERISILHLLHSVPLQPFANPYDQMPIFREGYTLSLDTERRLATILSFLASAKDGPDAIPAVCIAEAETPPRLQVLIAVNKRSLDGGRQTLERTREDFENVFRSLSQNCSGADEEAQNIFRTIVAVRSTRILCRLRLSPNSRKQAKAALKDVLQLAIQALRGRGALTFVERAKDVVSFLNAWTRHQVPGRLEDLVTGVWHLKRVDGLTSLVNSIPNSAMEPTARSNLLNIVHKVARYREAAYFLHRTVRENRVARRMQVVPIDLSHAAFDRSTQDASTESLASALEQIDGRFGLNQICQLLKITRPTAEARFVEQVTKALNGKIHAEIQLLFHCDQHKFQFAPRVVSSSKSACFLCNTVIRLHGKMYTPRCHGKLYPGWRLPLFPRSNIQQQFADLLESKIKESIQNLISTRRKTLYPDPNESTLSTLMLSSSVPGGSAPSSSSSSDSSIPSQAEASDVPSRKLATSDDPVSIYRVGPFEILVDTTDCDPDKDEMNLIFGLITAQESEGIDPSLIIDVESLHGETLREWDNAGCIHLAARGLVLKLCRQTDRDPSSSRDKLC